MCSACVEFEVIFDVECKGGPYSHFTLAFNGVVTQVLSDLVCNGELEPHAKRLYISVIRLEDFQLF